MSLNCVSFFERGTAEQFQWVLGKYEEALTAKAEKKNSKPEALIKLDKWFHNDLPKKIKSRGKDAHLTHEEICKAMKWKQTRGVFQAKLRDLIQINTPRVVMDNTKKAFRSLGKRHDLEAAISNLSALKGISPQFASAILVAYDPVEVPFMADECVLSLAGVEEVDYTVKRYMELVAAVGQCRERLGADWTAHQIDMAVWTYSILRDLKPELLQNFPASKARAVSSGQNGAAAQEGSNGKVETDNCDKEELTGAGVTEPSVDEQNRAGAPEPTLESNGSNGSTGESPSLKRPLDQSLEAGEEGQESKRAREESGEGTEEPASPHKPLSGQLLVC